MKKLSTLPSVQINLEKFKLLISGLADGGAFNKKVVEIRRKLRIPDDGLSTDQEIEKWTNWISDESDKVVSNKKWKEKIRKLDKDDPSFAKKKREIHKEIPLFFLGSSARDLVAKSPDLTENFIDTVCHYIKFGDRRIRIPNNYQIVIQKRNGKTIPTIELYGELTEHELAEMIKIIKLGNKHSEYFTSLKPLGELDKAITIMNLTKEKGTKLQSLVPDFEDDGKISDAYIVTEVVNERLDTRSRSKTNRAGVRKIRSRMEERLKEHFPKTYKPL